MNNSNVVALKYPGCGAALRIELQAQTHACGYCGATLRVDHAQDALSLSLVADAVAGVQRGTDRTAAELAIRRLSEDIKTLERGLVELRDRWDDELAAWSKAERLAAQRKGPRQELAQIAVAVVTFFVAFTVILVLSVAVSSEMPPALATLALAGAFYIAWRVGRYSPSLLYAKHRRQAVAEVQRRRDDALAAQEDQERELQKRISRTKERLRVNLQIADS